MQLPTSTIPGVTTDVATMSLYSGSEPTYRVHFDITPPAHGACRAIVTVSGYDSGLTMLPTDALAFDSTGRDQLISEAVRICRELGWIPTAA